MLSEGQAEVEALILRVAMRDRAAFARLYDLTSGKLLAVCLRVLEERSAAEDTMQEAFVKIWNSADRYQVTGHSPMTWLITIARNSAIDRRRKRRNESDIADYSDRIASPAQSPEQAAIVASESRRIVACLDTLEEDRRAAVSGAYLEGKSYKELAEQFAVPLNTMRTWLRRSLASLRECMHQ